MAIEQHARSCQRLSSSPRNCARRDQHPCGRAGGIAETHSGRAPKGMPRKRKLQQMRARDFLNARTGSLACELATAPSVTQEISAGSARLGDVKQTTGTGQLGEWLGFTKDSGVFLGGVWAGDTNYLISGGVHPGSWSWDSLLILSLGLDSEKLVGWKGGKFGIDFLRFDGDPTNQRAGSVQGYNSLPGPLPLHRSELYQLWWRQELFDGKLILRVGKMVPTADFNNVLRAVPMQDQSLFIPSVSGLLFTPVFVNPTLLGVMPGYYNSACGVTTTFAPTKNFYFSYGVYDGNIANGTQTGTRGPEFNGYYFNIWESGADWQIGSV